VKKSTKPNKAVELGLTVGVNTVVERITDEALNIALIHPN